MGTQPAYCTTCHEEGGGHRCIFCDALYESVEEVVKHCERRGHFGGHSPIKAQAYGRGKRVPAPGITPYLPTNVEIPAAEVSPDEERAELPTSTNIGELADEGEGAAVAAETIVASETAPSIAASAAAAAADAAPTPSNSHCFILFTPFLPTNTFQSARRWRQKMLLLHRTGMCFLMKKEKQQRHGTSRARSSASFVTKSSS